MKEPEEKPAAPRKAPAAETPSQRILLEEYRSLHASFIDLQSEGVNRLNFFITACSVLLGAALVFASDSNNIPVDIFKYILIAILAILFTIAIQIDDYMLFREKHLDKLDRGMARIRCYFVTLDPAIQKYFISSLDDSPTTHLVHKMSYVRASTQLLAGVLMGLLLAVSVSFNIEPIWFLGLVGLVGLILTYLLLEVYAILRLERARKHAEKDVRFPKGPHPVDRSL